MYTYKHTVCLYVYLFEPNEFLQKIVKNTVLRKECRAHCSYLASQFIGNTPGPSLGIPKVFWNTFEEEQCAGSPFLKTEVIFFNAPVSEIVGCDKYLHWK